MLQAIVGIIAFAALSVANYMNDRNSAKAQEQSDSTDWNEYYAHI